MDAFRDSAEPARAMIHGIHRGDHSEEHLGRADIAGGFVAANVLFAGLEREPVSRPAGRIVRNADKPPRHMALEGVAGREVGRMRSAETEWNTEALRAAHSDVGTHFARWLQERERKNI